MLLIIHTQVLVNVELLGSMTFWVIKVNKLSKHVL